LLCFLVFIFFSLLLNFAQSKDRLEEIKTKVKRWGKEERWRRKREDKNEKKKREGRR
jgi:hypothetical protein